MSLINPPVCIAVDHKYSENNGAWTEFWLFDGEEVTTKGGMYDDLKFDAYDVDATQEQILEASRIYEAASIEGKNYNKYANKGAGAYTFVGCVVTLSRSRKAPNKVPLLVTDYHDRYYKGGYWVNAKVDLKSPEGVMYRDVSINCLNEVVKGVKDLPFWYRSK